MKKRNPFYFIISTIFIFLLSSNQISATNVTWVGGIGDWFNSSNWDTGTVPGFGDAVFINSGNVFINYSEEGQALRVEIASGASLEIEGKAGLVIEMNGTLPGIINEGYLGNKGYIIVSNPVNQTNLAVRNSGIFNNSGSVQIFDVSQGLSNNTGGDFNNSGHIEIFDISGYGASALSNWADFSNTKYGHIEIHDVGGTAGTLSNTGGGYFGNAGNIELYDLSNPTTASLRVVSGLFENLNGGTVDISQVDGHGIEISANGTFRNRSTIYITGPGLHGIQNTGFFVNHQAGYILNWYSGADALINFPGGEFRNFGALFLHYSSGRTLTNQGIFNNYPKGYFFHDDQILSGTGANLVNQGHWESYHTGTHIISGPFTNKTVIGDQNDGFAGEITNNQGIRIHPMNGLVEVGDPYANLFDMGALNFITIQGFTDAPSSSTSVGTYNTSTNTFTPNSNALGLTEIYVSVKVNTGGNGRKYRIEIPGGVQPAPLPRITIGNPGDLTIEEKIQLSNHMESQTRIYPNPNNGDFNVELSQEINQVSSLQVLNVLGQIVYQVNPEWRLFLII
ncbi:MAG: hypothetical protein R2769_07210 [Saprospiraceae bacterium]